MAVADRIRDAPPARPGPGSGRCRLSRRADRPLRPRSLQKGPHLLEGKPPEAHPDRRAHGSARPAAPRRAHQRVGPADGAGLPALRARGEGAWPDRLPLIAHPERGGGPVRPGGHPPQWPVGRHGDALRHAPPLRADRRGDVRRLGAGSVPGPRRQLRRGRRSGRALPGAGDGRAPPQGAGLFGGSRAVEPGALARGALPRPLRKVHRPRYGLPEVPARGGSPRSSRLRPAVGGPAPSWPGRRRGGGSAPRCCGGSSSVCT